MKILISGGSGFIGSYLKEYFESRNYSVKTIGKNCNNSFVVDLLIESFQISENFDLIIHCAGVVHNEKHAQNIDENTIQNDFIISKNFIKSISGCNYKNFIYLSSVSIYGKESGFNIPEMNTSPVSGYGISKLKVEKMLTELFDNDKLLIFRLPLVKGHNPKGNLLRLITKIKRNQMVIFKNNSAVKSILEIQDLAQIIEIYGDSLQGIFNIKSKDIKFNDLVLEYAESYNKRVIILPFIVCVLLLKLTKYVKPQIYSTLNKMTHTLTFNNEKFLKTINAE